MPMSLPCGMEPFIEAIRRHPCLWDRLHSDYRDSHMKDAGWQQVVREVNMNGIRSIQAAKTEWKKLRDNHRDALKRAKLGKNKLLPAHITTWKYAKAMQFLEPHMKYRITECIDEPLLPAPATPPPPAAAAAERAPRRRPPREPLAADAHASEALDSFFNCIIKSTQAMPPWMQTRVKKRMFSVVIEAEEELHGLSAGSGSDAGDDAAAAAAAAAVSIKMEPMDAYCENLSD